jgi:hypothetical protein
MEPNKQHPQAPKSISIAPATGSNQPIPSPRGYPPQGYNNQQSYPQGYMPPQGYVYPAQEPLPQGMPLNCGPHGYASHGQLTYGYPQGYTPPPPGYTPPGDPGYLMAPATRVLKGAKEMEKTACEAHADGCVPVESPIEGVRHAEGEVYHPPALTHIEPTKPQNAFKRAWAKIGGGGLTLSLAIHAGLIILAGIIVVAVKQQQKQVDFLPGGGTQQGARASADMKHKVSNKKRTTISKSVPLKKVVSIGATSELSLPETPISDIEIPDVSGPMGGAMGSAGMGTGGSGGGVKSGVGLGGVDGFAPLPPSMRSRCSGPERLEKLRQSGGNAECEVAVTKSLAWLKTKQNPDGSWGKTNKAAMTGLALLCYLGRCETPDSPFYGENVMNCILYLVELSKKNKWGLIAEDARKHSSSYEHGIATYALGEMYTLARLGSRSLPGMKEAFEKGVELILENQLEDGGWGYGEGGDYCYRKTGRGDLSVTGWQYQALKAAKNTSLKINNLHKATDHAVDYLLSSQTKDGGFGNTNRDAGYNQWNLTGCGLLGLQTLGKSTKKSVTNKGVKFLTDFVTAEPLDWNRNCNLYAWYYMTQTMFQEGGDAWKMYNQQLLPQILGNQAPDGSWKAERANSPIAASSTAGADREVYRQVLCTLQLEVYYRYLKVADPDESSIFDK